MLTFLFWNLNKKPLHAVVCRLATRYDVDVLMLAECIIGAQELLGKLNPRRKPRYSLLGDRSKNIALYTRFPRQFVHPVPLQGQGSKRALVCRVSLPSRLEILLAVVHFPSKLHQSRPSQIVQAIEFSKVIQEVEKQVGHARTVLVGDLNMNPFEDGVVTAAGLHAVMTREVALRRSRTVNSQEYPFFYNPMWGLFGDATRGPPGTYYYSASEHLAYFWNIFDQVLLRPDLLPYFRNAELEVLSTDGKVSFLSRNGLPDTDGASDHLPMLFRLHL
jgi:hypothetical protein